MNESEVQAELERLRAENARLGVAYKAHAQLFPVHWGPVRPKACASISAARASKECAAVWPRGRAVPQFKG